MAEDTKNNDLYIEFFEKYIQSKFVDRTICIKDLIKNKDYDYVSYRMILPDGQDIFAGCFRSEGGKIISLDGDSYSEDEEVIRCGEWSSDKHSNGLTVWVEGEFL